MTGRRTVRRLRATVAGTLDLVAVLCGKLADRIDPPVPADRSEPSSPASEWSRFASDAAVRGLDPHELIDRLTSRARHPSTTERPETLLGDVAPQEQPLAAVVPIGYAQGRADLQLTHHSERLGWVPCTLGTITATRPIGARVRLLVREGMLTGSRLEGRIVDLRPSELSTVRYCLTVDLDDAGPPPVLDLPLSHPLEVNHE